MQKKEFSEPRFIKPPNTLKEKCGSGGISPELLKKSQDIIDNSPVDFTPEALEYLKTIEQNLDTVKKDPNLSTDPEFLDRFARPVMSLKANGGMFQYPLISMISDVALQFLDHVDNLDKDCIKIIRAHNNAVSLIVRSKLKGYTGPEGQKICNELAEACNRYFKKHNVQ